MISHYLDSSVDWFTGNRCVCPEIYGFLQIVQYTNSGI